MTKSTLRRFLFATTFVAVLPALSGTAHAENRYNAWTPPSAGTAAKTEGLLKELKALVDEAEKARAADGVFLRDLRDLMARYSGTGAAVPKAMQLLFDDFSDGDITRNPTWTIQSGEFWVQQGYGLRSKMSETAAAQPEPQKVSKEQLALSILGAVLQGRNKNTNDTAQATTTTDAEPAAPAVLSAGARVSNAFALTSSFSSWTETGSFAYGVAQGTSGAGYRVVYSPKQTARAATLQLVRLTSRGESTLDNASITALEDQKNHSLEWMRDKYGQMQVNLDGKKILSSRDTSFRDPFDAVTLHNSGADVIVQKIEVTGSNE